MHESAEEDNRTPDINAADQERIMKAPDSQKSIRPSDDVIKQSQFGSVNLTRNLINNNSSKSLSLFKRKEEMKRIERENLKIA